MPVKREMLAKNNPSGLVIKARIRSGEEKEDGWVISRDGERERETRPDKIRKIH